MRVSGAPTEWMTRMPSDLAKLFCIISTCWAPEIRSDAPSRPLSATLDPVIANHGPKVLSSVPLRKRSATIATPAKRLSPIVSRSIGYQPFGARSEEHTSELQYLMRNSYSVFFWNKKKKKSHNHTT